MDASNDFSIDNIPTAADLTTYAQNYATNNDIESPKLTASIEFVPLWQTDEYKEVAPLERVSLGDTVHADVSEMGMTATARVIKTVWNLNTQRYDSLILGSVKSSLASIIQSTVQTARDEAEKATSVVSGQMNEIASLIINGLGLHRTLVPTADGGYKVYLHNHATLADSDVQYYMSAGGIMVSTDYGQTWNAGFDAEGNAVLNSLATITLKALEIYGSRIVFGDIDNKYIIGFVKERFVPILKADFGTCIRAFLTHNHSVVFCVLAVCVFNFESFLRLESNITASVKTDSDIFAVHLVFVGDDVFVVDISENDFGAVNLKSLQSDGSK